MLKSLKELKNEGGEKIVFDATEAVVGRLASIIAKELLNGKEIVVVNVEKAIITGRKERVIEWYRSKLQVKSKVNPRRHGPFHPRTPNGIFRRIVRGMLPRRKPKGRDALRRLKVYVGIPEAVKEKPVRIKEALYRRSPYGYVTLEELARVFGWRPVIEKVGRA